MGEPQPQVVTPTITPVSVMADIVTAHDNETNKDTELVRLQLLMVTGSTVLFFDADTFAGLLQGLRATQKQLGKQANKLILPEKRLLRPL